jgi:hypothetical protein
MFSATQAQVSVLPEQTKFSPQRTKTATKFDVQVTQTKSGAKSSTKYATRPLVAEAA